MSKMTANLSPMHQSILHCPMTSSSENDKSNTQNFIAYRVSKFWIRRKFRLRCNKSKFQLSTHLCRDILSLRNKRSSTRDTTTATKRGRPEKIPTFDKSQTPSNWKKCGPRIYFVIFKMQRQSEFFMKIVLLWVPIRGCVWTKLNQFDDAAEMENVSPATYIVTWLTW